MVPTRGSAPPLIVRSRPLDRDDRECPFAPHAATSSLGWLVAPLRESAAPMRPASRQADGRLHAAGVSGRTPATPRIGALAPGEVDDRFSSFRPIAPDARNQRIAIAGNPRLVGAARASSGRSLLAHCATGSARLRRRADTPRAYVEPVVRRTSVRFCVSFFGEAGALSLRAPSECTDCTRPGSRRLRRGVIERDFRKRDEEKLADAAT